MDYSKSAQLLERAKKVLAGGVSSEFRKFSHPHALFYTHGTGSRVYDVDGNEYLDFTLSQGPLILGHSHPEILQAVASYSEKGQLFAGQHMQEIELAEKLNKLIPSAELMRFCLDGSEAIQTAFRVARARTGRKKFLRFEGHYHGWLDNVAWGISAPSREALGDRDRPNVFPWSQGLPEASRDEFITIPWNDIELLRQVVARERESLAAIITEPVMCNSGCILPAEGFLEELRALCTMHGIALIFDEVITGFRLHPGGAQAWFNVTPDLSVFAKAMGSGYPISVIAGKRDWMSLVENSTVIQAGTLNSGNAGVAAALATLEILERDKPHERLFQLGSRLMDGLRKIASDRKLNLLVQGPGPLFHTGFTARDQVKEFRHTFDFDKARLNRFIAGMHDRGIRIIGRGLWYISAAHREQDIDQALETASEVLTGDF